MAAEPIESDESGDRQRQTVLTRLARVEAALRQWSAYETDVALREQQRGGVSPPPVSRDTLEDWRRALTEELAGLPEASLPTRRR